LMRRLPAAQANNACHSQWPEIRIGGQISRMTHPHSSTVAGAAQDWATKMHQIGAYRHLHLISRLTPARHPVGGTSERCELYIGHDFPEQALKSHGSQPKMLNNIQYIPLAVDFSELLNIVSPWKLRSTASTTKFNSWLNCASDFAKTIHSCDSNWRRHAMKTND